MDRQHIQCGEERADTWVFADGIPRLNWLFSLMLGDLDPLSSNLGSLNSLTAIGARERQLF
jgi:hypothetical protein